MTTDPVAAVQLPDGNYFFALDAIPENFGGLTKACLARARAFADHAGTAATVLVLRAREDYAAERRDLEERGLLQAPTQLRYLHQALMEWDYHADPGEVPPDPPGLVPTRLERPPSTTSTLAQKAKAQWHKFRNRAPEPSPETVWRTDWHTPTGELRVQDHFRPDGSLYIRREIHQEDGKDLTRTLTLHDHQQRERDRFRSIPALSREWITRLSGDEPTFLVVDGQSIGQHLRRVRSKNRYIFQVMHGTHIKPPIRIDGPIRPVRTHMIRDLAEWDGLVLLTDSQRRDVALRNGDRSNLFVIGNESRPLPDWPDPEQRDPHTALVVSRLVRGKRVDHTLRAFRAVVDRVPQARLVIFGDGEERSTLEETAAELGLGSAVTFRGHDPKAADAFRTASVSVLSSAWEGQPLTVLESLSAGCPVIAFDITYGPADMITDGREGRLVPDGDTAALADALVDVLSDPNRARAMSRAAWERSFAFDGEHLVQRWADTFATAVDQRGRRVKLGAVDAACDTHTVEADQHRLTATLRATAKVPKAARDNWRIRWVLVDRESGTHRLVPAEAQLDPDRTGDGDWAWQVSGSFAADPFDPAGTLHLDLVWNNTHWRSTAIIDPQ